MNDNARIAAALVLNLERTARRIVASDWHAEAARYRMKAMNASTHEDRIVNDLVARDLSESADKLLRECP